VKFKKAPMPGLIDPVKRLMQGVRPEEKKQAPASATVLPGR